MIRHLLTLCALALLSCATPGTQSDSTLLAGVIVYKATAELIERADDQADRAGRVLRHTETIEALLDADEPISIALLHQAIHIAIDWESIPPIDRPLVEALIEVIRARLEQETSGAQLLTPGTVVNLRHILTRIRSAAHFYS